MIQHITVKRSDTIRDAMRRLDASAAGILLLVQDDGLFERTVTDGDLRRLLLQGHELGAFLSELPKTASFTLKENEYTKADALALMNAKTVNHVPIIDSAGNAVGLLSRKDVDEYVLLSTPHMGDAEREFVEEAFRTNWIAPLGPNVDAFERELADWVGIRHAAAVSSGTAAIHLALRLLDVGQGDIVFCSALTFVATANPIVYQGAEPVFIDSDPDSWNMSPVALESALKQARASGRLPKAVIIVNLYGQSADMDPLLSLCDQYGVPVIEDAAESLGATYKQRASGTFGRIGIFSFNGNKIITTSGGGMLVSDDESLVKKARFLATQAREPVPHYEHQTVGYNYRMSNLLAGVGRGQLKVLSDRVSARRQVFERYREALADLPAIEWMPEPAWSLSNRWLTTGTVQSRYTDVSALEFIKRLAAELIEARPVWKPMQLQPVFSGCRYFCHENESVSARLFETGFCLPSGSNMTERQQCRVIEAVRKILA